MGPSRASVGASMSDGVRASEAMSDGRQAATQSQALVRPMLLVLTPLLAYLASSCVSLPSQGHVSHCQVRVMRPGRILLLCM
jgi:hypothetical protein